MFSLKWAVSSIRHAVLHNVATLPNSCFVNEKRFGCGLKQVRFGVQGLGFKGARPLTPDPGGRLSRSCSLSGFPA